MVELLLAVPSLLIIVVAVLAFIALLDQFILQIITDSNLYTNLIIVGSSCMKRLVDSRTRVCFVEVLTMLKINYLVKAVVIVTDQINYTRVVVASAKVVAKTMVTTIIIIVVGTKEVKLVIKSFKASIVTVLDYNNVLFLSITYGKLLFWSYHFTSAFLHSALSIQLGY